MAKEDFIAWLDRDTMKLTDKGRLVKVFNGTQIYRGRVSRVSQRLDLNNGLYQIRIRSESEIKSNWAWFEAELDIPMSKNKITIPLELVWSIDKQPFVWMIRDGVAKKAFVELGFSDGYQVIAKSGVIAER